MRRLFSSIPSRSFPSPAPRAVPGGSDSAARSAPSPCPPSVLLIPLRDAAVPSPRSVLPLLGPPRCLSPVCAVRSSLGPPSPPCLGRDYPGPRSLPFLPGPCCPLLPTPRSPGAPAAPGAVSPELPPVLSPPGLLCAPVDPVHHGHAQVRHAARGVTVAKMILPRKAKK